MVPYKTFFFSNKLTDSGNLDNLLVHLFSEIPTKKKKQTKLESSCGKVLLRFHRWAHILAPSSVNAPKQDFSQIRRLFFDTICCNNQMSQAM